MHVVLVNPQIPQNSGNIIRLCANTGFELHLVEPLGFLMDDARLRRAGLDYHEYARVTRHPNLDSALAGHTGNVWGFSAEGRRRYTEVQYGPDDVLVFGCENPGLSPEHKAHLGDQLLTIPMRPNNRSLNLANAVSVVMFEAWRQHDFAGAA